MIVLLENQDLNFDNCLTVVNPNQVRQRKY